VKDWRIALALVLLLLFVLGAFGCGSTQMATYGAALSGAYQPYPLYQYPPQEYQSQYVVPRTACMFQGNTEVCRPI
jgi:hypothetical protein